MTGWVARWRVALRIAWRDARRNKGRTALVVAMVALPLLAGTGAITAIRSAEGDPTDALGPSAQALVEDQGCGEVQQMPDLTGIACDGSTESVPIEAGALSRLVGGAPVAELRSAGVDLLTDDAVIAGEVLISVDDADALAPITDLVDGELPDQVGEIAMPGSMTSRLKLDLGDEVELARGESTVSATLVGVTSGIGPGRVIGMSGTVPEEWVADPDTSAGWAHPSTWVVLGANDVTWEQVLAANENGWTVLSRAVLLDPPPAEDVPYGMVDGQDSRLRDVGLIAAVLAMGLLEVALLIGPAFAVGARRDARKLALMAASGARPQDLRRTVLASGLVAGLVAAVTGIGGGLLISAGVLWWLRREAVVAARLVLPTWELPVMALIALMIGVGAAWLPARSASRADVVATLAGRRSDAATTRGVPRLGVAVLALGVVGLAAAAVMQQPVGLVAGVVVLEIGVVLVSGGAVALAALLAPRAGFATRFAMRDAARHRGRSAPAVAAISVAVAAAAAGTVFATGQSAATQASWIRIAEAPAVILSLDPEMGELTPDVVAQREQRVTAGLDLATARIEGSVGHVVYGAVPIEREGSGPDDLFVSVYAEQDPDLACPYDDPSQHPEDSRCDAGMPLITSGAGWYANVLIDDGTVVEATGLPGWEQAQQTLAAGGVLVSDAASVWPNGTARIINDSDGGTPGEVDAEIPAYATGWTSHTMSLVLSPQAAEALGFEPIATGGLVTAPTWPDQSVVDGLNADFRQSGLSTLWLTLDKPRSDSMPIAWLLAGIAAVVALIAVGLAVGLAAADARPDMATMMAIGAPPRVRRRISAAQAGLLAGTGAVLGVPTGIVIGLVLALWSREQTGYRDMWPLTVPWQVATFVVIVPLVAIAVTWLLTRSRLPLVRRVAE